MLKKYTEPKPELKVDLDKAKYIISTQGRFGKAHQKFLDENKDKNIRNILKFKM